MVQERTYSKVVYFIVFLLLCFSGNPFFIASSTYKMNFIICTLFLCSACFFQKKSWIIVEFLKYFLPYLFLFTIQLIIIPGVGLSGITLFILKNIIGCTAIMLLGKDFETPYINVMFWLSIVSLIGFTYNMITENVLGFPLPYERYSLIIYTQLSGFEGFIGRNSGMFWEPGAFQGYINLALVLLVNNQEIKYKIIRFVFLVLALLTTYSTTGYVVFGVILTFMVLQNKKTSIIVKVLLIIALIVSFFYLYYGLDFLHDKIEWETTLTSDKDTGRLLDYQYFSHRFEDNFLFGISFVDMASGNGFLSHILCLGVLGASYYYVLLYVQLRKSLPRKQVLIFLFILILCLQGEGFLDYPLFLALPFLKLQKRPCQYTLAPA